jgi:hypothetical protein
MAATSVYQRFLAILRREKSSEPIFYMLLRGGKALHGLQNCDEHLLFKRCSLVWTYGYNRGLDGPLLGGSQVSKARPGAPFAYPV